MKRYTDKFQEAEFFLEKVETETASVPHLKYYISAFLSASRSVLQYIYDEVKDTPNHLSWYKKSSTQITKFMKCIRDDNIHYEPISLNGEMIAHVPPINLNTFEAEGEGFIEIKFWFPDWKGTEEGKLLCKKYLEDINNILDEGKQLNYL